MCHLGHRGDPDFIVVATIVDATTGSNMIVRKSIVLCNVANKENEIYF